jgi:DNA-binding LytR/AlgR family response regulator
MRCIIVDDESGAIEILTRYVGNNPELELVGAFRDAVEALTFLTRTKVDLILLDIDMPNLDGMQLAELVREKDIKIIFCTAYAEYAVNSYEKDAVDYLLKPISYERFAKAVQKALKTPSGGREAEQKGIADKKEKDGKLFIKSGPLIHQVDIKEVLFIEKKGHYVVFHTPAREFLSRMNMNELMKALPSDSFIRVHRSFVVAIDKIDTIEKYRVVIGEKKIPIGESYRDDFLNRIPYSGN